MTQKRILALITDLFFSVRVETGLGARGYDVIIADDTDLHDRLTSESPPALVIVDIGGFGLDWEAAIQSVRTHLPSVPILAFGSHVDLDARQRALDAGATKVVAKSRFVEALPELVSRLMVA